MIIVSRSETVLSGGVAGSLCCRGDSEGDILTGAFSEREPMRRLVTRRHRHREKTSVKSHSGWSEWGTSRAPC